MPKEKLEKITKIFPAYDKRNSVPKKNYGISSVRVAMVLKGSEGAVQFIFGTGMFLPETMQEYAKEGKLNPGPKIGDDLFLLNKPMGYDVGYHSPKPMYEGQELIGSKKTDITYINNPPKGLKDYKFKTRKTKPPICDYLGVPCYYDGSSMAAEKYMDVLLREGSDKIWEMLERQYETRFVTKKPRGVMDMDLGEMIQKITK